MLNTYRDIRAFDLMRTPSSYKPLIEGVWLTQTDQYIHLALEQPRQVLSSAVLGGGLAWADHFVNLRVNPHDYDDSDETTPAQTLKSFCQRQGWQGNLVGMMTAASMRSMRVKQVVLQGVSLCVLLTSGMENARRAGDKADHHPVFEPVTEVGTINLAIISSALFTPAAMVEAVMIATEAKAAALQERTVLSPVSQRIATGTGTDAIAFINAVNDSGHRAQPVVEYCGKHTLLGERLAVAVMEALADSMDY
ncbi:adenosylcobinamide amidohydrolase [Pseudomaricurvus alkylphenolicus]|uniref:adenosylcobinamide amidohydrolase n=1 Tax=Pseudomaricurvus alkylphenolicus TaxID=1306991 RepID=UPI00142070F9|nr:adenosylcobinamide amidohydrolase [Pseudomaricurvus alkylphenolicus]NIB38109.1 adenosylcobinamide amidohydrolase [Pseudomaricurvus alkylphenolicus]